MSYISVNNLSVNLNGKNVLSYISFSINKGSIIGLIGANGSGKLCL